MMMPAHSHSVISLPLTLLAAVVAIAGKEQAKPILVT